MSRGPDAGTLLARALTESSPGLAVTAGEATRWASATFTGARHSIMMSGPNSCDLDGWIEALDEHEFDLRGHLVADIGIVDIVRTDLRAELRIEALTVEI
ncbi:hypothetical protein EAH87_10970 [Sphingomonas koreensis]|nr:hypothetical protein EAH87_10970 [Sphingomonas koreensis]